MHIKVSNSVSVTCTTPMAARDVVRAITEDDSGENVEVTTADGKRIVNAGRFCAAMKHLSREGAEV